MSVSHLYIQRTVSQLGIMSDTKHNARRCRHALHRCIQKRQQEKQTSLIKTQESQKGTDMRDEIAKPRFVAWAGKRESTETHFPFTRTQNLFLG